MGGLFNPLPSHSHSLSLSFPLNTARRSRVWGRAPAEIEFGAF